MVGLDDVVIVDILDYKERQRTGYIRYIYHSPSGMVIFWVDPESPYLKPVCDKNKTFIFYSAVGRRPARTFPTLQELGIQKKLPILLLAFLLNRGLVANYSN